MSRKRKRKLSPDEELRALQEELRAGEAELRAKLGADYDEEFRLTLIRSRDAWPSATSGTRAVSTLHSSVL